MSLWMGTLSQIVQTSIPIPAIGANVYGGYYTGMIDTSASAGLKYLLIVSPKSLETFGLKWNSGYLGPSSAYSVWNGLTATIDMYNGGSDYQAATYCYNLSFPSDGGSRWYLPARDELELIYRNLKPSADANFDSSGSNPSSSPVGSPYTPSNPAQTSVTLFQAGNSQAMNSVTNTVYYTATQFDDTVVWGQYFGPRNGLFTGSQGSQNKNAPNLYSIRPVRRVLL